VTGAAGDERFGVHGVYQRDPGALPDSAFEPGELRHLVPGNRARLLDARRTPVTVRGIAMEQGVFDLEVTAFEDAGARWRLPFEDVERYQFARGGETAPPETVAAYRRAVDRLGRPLIIPFDRKARAVTLRRLAAERERVRAWLGRRLPDAGLDLPRLLGGRDGDDRLFDALEDLMGERGLAGVETGFGEVFVSHPGSGETVKGHAIVLAEMGLVAYRGTVVRDPGLFDGAWSRERRRSHVLTRLAFVQELLTRAGLPAVMLYRGAAWDRRPLRRRRGSFVSATFDRAVAEAHFAGGPATVGTVLHRQLVSVERLFMTFLETRALNGAFKEAEAVLLATAGRAPF
jgi:hypothetical protein